MTRGAGGTVLHLHDWEPVPSGATHAGSLYAVQGPDRVRAARELAAAGWWIHVDVILRRRADGSADPDTGVTRAELAAVRRELPDALVDVHVMDLTGSPGRLDAVLPDVLAARPDRVALPAARCPRDDPAARAVAAAGARLWAEAGPRTRVPGDLPADADLEGVLVVLIDPGTTGSIDLARMSVVRSVPAGLLVGVDGGLGRHHTSQALEAGARHLVSGRALLSPAGTAATAADPSDRTKESERA